VSLHRKNPRRDANEPIVLETFEKAGCAVLPVSITGGPDAIVFYPSHHAHAGCWLIEIKTRLGKLTKAQKDFRLKWTGPPIHLVRSPEDALHLLKGVRPVAQD
jgi:hypothetical protein